MKIFLDYNAQLDKLNVEKNLQIDDMEYAEMMLRRVGYFSLISGYKEPFKNSTTKKYKDGTKFEDIVALYLFDENLRELFLKYILQIERHVRSLLSYYFTEKYGEKQDHYLNAANFTKEINRAAQVQRLIHTLENLAIKNSDYPYINHQRIQHGNVPLWVLVNGLSFGTLSKFFTYTTPDLKTKVAKNFDGVNERKLEQFLSVLTKFRNVCAHNERLFSYHTKKDIPDMTLHVKLGIPKKGLQFVYGKHDLFAVVIAFRYLLPNEDFKLFKAQLKKAIRNYMNSTGAISESEILHLMGFPVNWGKITQYKK